MSEKLYAIGWVREDGEENIVPQVTRPLADAADLAGKLNAAPKGRATDEPWFVMYGPAECAQRCADCEDAVTHHWLPEPWSLPDTEAAVLSAHGLDGDHVYNCRHCDAWRTLTAFDEE